MANLIKNGDFSLLDRHWTASNPENVAYEHNHCIIARPASLSQEVETGASGGGEFMLSARVKTLPGFATRITLQPLPTGESVVLDASGNQSWIVQSVKFSVQDSTIKFRLTLEANDGEQNVRGVYFSDLTLSKLF